MVVAKERIGEQVKALCSLESRSTFGDYQRGLQKAWGGIWLAWRVRGEAHGRKPQVLLALGPLPKVASASYTTVSDGCGE